MSHVIRKPAFGVCYQRRLKQAYSADETSQGLESSAIASKGITLPRQQNNKGADQTARIGADQTARLFTYGNKRFFPRCGSYFSYECKAILQNNCFSHNNAIQQ